MTIPTISRRSAIVGAAAFGFMVRSTSAQSTPVADTFPITIDHLYGSTTIEQAPERILTIGWSTQDAVIALGPWSPEFLKRFGYTITMLRKRGYHLQFTGGATISAPFLDAETATVISPVREGLRVLTGAELARFDAQPTPVQMQRSTRAAEELLDLGAPVEADAWYGNRPCMPDMLPLAGPAPRHKGLWFHFGHGHQGFTLGPTTANALAETMAGGSAPIPELLPARLRSL